MCKDVNYSLLLIWVLFTTSFAGDQNFTIPTFDECLTAIGDRGLCVKLEDCDYLQSLTTKSARLTTVETIFLEKSRCGYLQKKLLVCCPSRYVRIPRELLLPTPEQCGMSFANRIYGGHETTIDEYPWLALIEYTKSNGDKVHHCGGSLISDRYVITAAHCVTGTSLSNNLILTGVRLGEWDTSTNRDCEIVNYRMENCAPSHVDVLVERIIPHPLFRQYNQDHVNVVKDIALLRLQRKVDYTEFVRPICLPLSANLRSAFFDGVAMGIAGWGKTKTETRSSIKLKSSVKGIPLAECRKLYETQKVSLEMGQMCAGGDKGVDSCRGDSGGPLVALDTGNNTRNHYVLVGIISFGRTPCGLEGWPAVYTHVGSYMDWILENIES